MTINPADILAADYGIPTDDPALVELAEAWDDLEARRANDRERQARRYGSPALLEKWAREHAEKRARRRQINS